MLLPGLCGMGRSRWLREGFGGDKLGGKGFETLKASGSCQIGVQRGPGWKEKCQPRGGMQGLCENCNSQWSSTRSWGPRRGMASQEHCSPPGAACSTTNWEAESSRNASPWFWKLETEYEGVSRVVLPQEALRRVLAAPSVS